MNKFRWVGLTLFLSSASCHAEVLFLAHFDRHRPDADYAASGVKTATSPNAARGGELRNSRDILNNTRFIIDMHDRH